MEIVYDKCGIDGSRCSLSNLCSMILSFKELSYDVWFVLLAAYGGLPAATSPVDYRVGLTQAPLRLCSGAAQPRLRGKAATAQGGGPNWSWGRKFLCPTIGVTTDFFNSLAFRIGDYVPPRLCSPSVHLCSLSLAIDPHPRLSVRQL